MQQASDGQTLWGQDKSTIDQFLTSYGYIAAGYVWACEHSVQLYAEKEPEAEQQEDRMSINYLHVNDEQYENPQICHVPFDPIKLS